MAEKVLTKKGVWKHHRRVAWRRVADEAVILNVESAVYFSLSGAGARMWELLGEGKNAQEIARGLADEYEAGEDELRDDCAELVGALQREGLIERA